MASNDVIFYGVTWQIKLGNYVYFTVKTALIFQQFLLNYITFPLFTEEIGFSNQQI